MTRPPIVSDQEWRSARDALLDKEKRLTRAQDALAAERRRLPMVHVGRNYRFDGPDGTASLPGLFEGRSQLIVYSFMWHGAGDFCSGCSMFVDNLGHPAHLHARDVSLALVSTGPLTEILPYRRRMGWDIPWYAAPDGAFNHDMGAGDGFALNVFLRDGEDVYRTYTTTGRGVERLGSNWTLLDLTPYGRQEHWEDSPEGRPQSAPYQWWRLHDEYGS
ncbi:DUF899 domain-containing protein [Nonomuraea wenchangensis]|uniref:DUF899 domain-containing protein n=1 Tax=Nonomuraea wenchangensis TaxID=568860 RepID=UPI003409256B